MDSAHSHCESLLFKVRLPPDGGPSNKGIGDESDEDLDTISGKKNSMRKEGFRFRIPTDSYPSMCGRDLVRGIGGGGYVGFQRGPIPPYLSLPFGWNGSPGVLSSAGDCVISV